jgi:hypothetical protein
MQVHLELGADDVRVMIDPTGHRFCAFQTRPTKESDD